MTEPIILAEVTGKDGDAAALLELSANGQTAWALGSSDANDDEEVAVTFVGESKARDLLAFLERAASTLRQRIGSHS